MRKKILKITALAPLLCCLSLSVMAGAFDEKNRDFVLETVDRICSKIDSMEGESEETKLKGEVDAGLDSFLKKIAKLNSSASIERIKEKYKSVPRSDLLALVKDRLKCRTEMFQFIIKLTQPPPADNSKKRSEQEKNDPERELAAANISNASMREENRITSNKNWEAYFNSKNNQETCFVVTKISKRTPNLLPKSESKLYWSFGKTSHTVYTSVKLPASIDEDQPVKAILSPVAYKMGSKKNLIFINSESDSRSINADINKDKSLILTYYIQGQEITEIFSLDGYIKAWREARSKCFNE